MKITYDKSVNAMYIALKKGKYNHTQKISDDILVDVSKKGEILGVEILEASKNIGKVKPEQLKVEVATI